MPAYSITDPAVAAFVVLPLLLVTLFLWGTLVAVRRQGRSPVRALVMSDLVATTWLTATWVAASTGILRQWDAVPPPLLLLLLGVGVLAVLIAFSSVGRALAQLPLWTLIAFQGFRFPLELAMHAMYERGIMPEQMSYSGRNFDIVTGMSALVVAALVRNGRAYKLAWAWNVMGLLLVLNVATVGVLSTPLFAYFGEERLNVWITYPPFVWLPAVMVVAAIAGHLVIFRALGMQTSQTGTADQPRSAPHS